MLKDNVSFLILYHCLILLPREQEGGNKEQNNKKKKFKKKESSVHGKGITTLTELTTETHRHPHA